MAWRTCMTCKGSGKDPNPKTPPDTRCPACRGAGGADTMTTP